ncbi:hypothetical protein BS50DRAFT_566559 [Corynespora cassiicola Philippines]|uniref:Hly-III related protein n=1 Tax=Corynespora cassiicola Philippines TaxID=1448308 RepID=A0A2T2N089_CORCC|nr:hypothetical protein BS50DRAFT_566559 [Corynespora cassiicola Philippines]
MLNRQRPRTFTYGQCVASIAGCHSETINIWSHLLGACWFTLDAIRSINAFINSPSPGGIVVIIYLAAFASCFWCSTMYHVLASHAQASFWQQVDHVGILIAIWASVMAFVLFSFEDQRGAQWTYVFLVTFAAILCAFRLTDLQGRHIRQRQSRIALHIVFGGLAVIPSLHSWFQYRGPARPNELLYPFWILVAINSMGGGIYAVRIFNKTGNRMGIPDVSHNIMHVFVVAGAFQYGQSLLRIYQTRILEA